MRFDKVQYEASYGTSQQLPKSDAVEIATPPVSTNYVNRTVRVPVSIGRFGGT